MAESFFKELKRRNVFRVAAIYIVVAWLVMQIGDVMFPALRLPEWTTTLLAAFLLLGLPIAVVFAWAFELTPDGVVRTSEVSVEQSITATTATKINYMIIAGLALAVAFLLVKDVFQPGDESPAEVAAPDRSIAVLPFKNQSASEENAEFFSGGLHDELLTLLSRIGDLKVISRTSVERLDTSLSVPEIGSLLGVATVLEGQVQRAGNRLRINVQLIDTAGADHIWASTYDRELTAENVFDVQADIARTIAAELQASLSPDDEQLLAKVGTSNFEALENYLLGVQLEKRGSYESLDEAVVRLRRATENDPSYAEAWVALAHAYDRQVNTGAINIETYAPAAKQAIDRALALDPGLPQAHALLGSWYMRAGNAVAAEASFREALRLNPGDSESISMLGRFLRVIDQPNAAVDVLEEGLAVDPLSAQVWFELGKAHLHAGRPERVQEIAGQILEMDPVSVNGLTLQLQSYLWRGQYDLLFASVNDAMEQDPRDHELFSHFSMQMESLGLPGLADRYFARGEELDADSSGVLQNKVLILHSRGQFDAAYQVAREALEKNVDLRWGSDRVFLRTLRTRALATGEFNEAVRWYGQRYPELLATSPEINNNNVFVAGDLGLLLRETGSQDEGDALVRAALAWQQANHPANSYGYVYGVLGAELLALDGQPDEALAELRRAVDSGWRFHWRFSLSSEGFDSLRDRPEFQEIIEFLEADMVRLRELVLALPDQGMYDLRD
jgi:TolB-like protein/Tfp pilus assembly protein PilF